MVVRRELIVVGKGSDISCDLEKVLDLRDDEYDVTIGLKSFSTYNNMPNVEVGVNNKIKIKVPNKDYEICELETGAYELSAIAKEILHWICHTYPELEDVEKQFELTGNNATSKAEFHFKVKGYGVSFDVSNSLCTVLGFKKTDTFEGKGRFKAEKIVNIAKVSQLVFNCNLVEGDYVNGSRHPFIYNCTVDVPPGYRLEREVTDISYKKITSAMITHIRIWIVDQRGAPVNLREDEFSVTLSLKFESKIARVTLT